VTGTMKDIQSAPSLAKWDAARREAVARAICSACHENPDHVGDARGNARRWEDYLDAADAAISEVRKAATAGPLPTVAWLTTDEEGGPSMLFFDREEAAGYCDADEDPISLGLLVDLRERSWSAGLTEELVARCREILQWRKTGQLKGEALRELAKTLVIEGNDDELRRSEDITIEQALQVVADLEESPA